MGRCDAKGGLDRCSGPRHNRMTRRALFPAARQHRAGLFVRSEIVSTSISISSASRLRARWTRDLMVPTAQPQISAASSYENPDAPTRTSASRWSERQLLQRWLEFLELHLTILIGRGLQRFRIATVAVFDLAPALAIFRAEMIAQNCEQPGRHVGAGLNDSILARRATAFPAPGRPRDRRSRRARSRRRAGSAPRPEQHCGSSSSMRLTACSCCRRD